MALDSPRSLADKLGLSEGHVRRLCAEGKIANSKGERPEKLPGGSWAIKPNSKPVNVQPRGRPRKEKVN